MVSPLASRPPAPPCITHSRLQIQVIGTKNEIASIYDIEINRKIRELRPTESNAYTRNRATFDPTDDLVLNDGVLYDMRMAKEVRLFFSPYVLLLAACFLF